MSRWGRPTKNSKKRDPRYFLNESVELEEAGGHSSCSMRGYKDWQDGMGQPAEPDNADYMEGWQAAEERFGMYAEAERRKKGDPRGNLDDTSDIRTSKHGGPVPDHPFYSGDYDPAGKNRKKR